MKPAAAKTALGFQHILFATDFSAASNNAIPYVKRIAKHYDADVVAFNVQPMAVNPMTLPEAWASDAELARARNEKHREELFHSFEGVRTRVVIEEGELKRNLQEAVQRYDTDLMVLGTRGRTGVGKLLLGSVAEEIFRTATCPVLTVGPEADLTRGGDGEIREILYATDFNSESSEAAGYAVSLAQEFQARLVLLHVFPDKGPGDLVSAHEVEESSKALLDKLVPAEAKVWCSPEVFVERGNPADKILEFAKLRESDLIVIGVKPETGLPGAATHLPIATAHKVVSRAMCPVLTVRS